MNNIKKILIILTILFQSCDTTDPPPDDNNDKKEFVWSDEIIPGGEGVIPTGIWGSSPNDLWVSGWRNNHQGIVLHFDGNEWNEWNDETPTLPFNDEYMDVFGFDSTNIYVVGHRWWILENKMNLSSLVLYFNGTNWEIVVDDPTNNGSPRSIHGSSQKNIWVGGKNGAIYHYYGVNWQRKHYTDMG